jgi:hypothetical protein
MSEPPTTHASLSATGYTDGFGRRTLEFDRESGGMLERLHVRAEFSAFEAALRQPADRLAAFDDARWGRVRGIERNGSGSLSVLSAYVPSDRLCDLLEAATSLPAHEATSPSVDAALGFLLETLSALDAFHSGTGLAHGAVAPGRIALTSTGKIVLLDGLFGQALDRLQINRRRLWTEFGLAMPAVAGPSRFDRAADISQASLAAMMIVLGRPFLENDYPDALPDSITEVIEIAQIRGSVRFASDLHKFLHRALPLPARRTHASAEEAATEVRQIAREIGVQRCRDALTAFVGDMNRVLSEPRGTRVPEYAAAVEVRTMPAPESAFEEPVSAELLDHYTIDETEPAPFVEETIVASVDREPIVEAPLAATPEPPPSLETAEPEPLPVPEPPPLESPLIAAVAVPEAQPAPAAVTPPPAPVVVEVRPTEIEPIPAPAPAIEPIPVPAPAIEPASAPARAIEPSAPEPAATQPTPELTPDESKRARRNARRHRDKLRSHAVPPPAPPPAARAPLIQPTPAMAAMMPLPSVPPPAPPPRKIAQPLRDEAPIAEPVVPIVPLAPVRVEPSAAAPLPIAPVAFKAAPVPFQAEPVSFKPEPLSFRNDSVPVKTETIAFKNDQHAVSRMAFRPERRDPRDVPGPRFEFAREQKRTFPWRLAAAAVVVIAVGIGAGRKYLPGNEPPQPAPVPSNEVVAAAKAAEAAEKTGTVVLTTEPVGAHVLLDGKEMGDSPLTLENVPAGKHALMFVTASASVKRIIRVETGKTVSLDVAVFSGWIAVYSPIPLDISENGRAIGSSEQGRLMLSPGRHQLTLTNTELGYSTVQNVDIEPGEERPISVQPTGELSANASPWAEVWMNGKKVGETPVAGLMVPLGTHEILFKNPQFPERRVTVTVSATTPVSASVDFSK